MLEPSIDSLQKQINSKYELIIISAKRAREMRDDENFDSENYDSHQYVGMALEEINEGKLRIQE